MGVYSEEGVQAPDMLEVPCPYFIQMVGSKELHEGKKRGHRRGAGASSSFNWGRGYTKRSSPFAS